MNIDGQEIDVLDADPAKVWAQWLELPDHERLRFAIFKTGYAPAETPEDKPEFAMQFDELFIRLVEYFLNERIHPRIALTVFGAMISDMALREPEDSTLLDHWHDAVRERTKRYYGKVTLPPGAGPTKKPV